MKKRNFISAFVLSAVLSVTSLAFSCHAMQEDEGTLRPTAASAAAVVATSADQSEFQSACEEDMMLVHLTKYCPEGNIMIPGSVTQYNDRSTNRPMTDAQRLAIAKLCPPTRATLHWTLNGTMPAHEGFSGQVDRKSYPYAVIVPMTAVKQQILGGNQLDIFTIGRVTLSSDSIIVMSLDNPINTEGMNSQIIRFDSSQENIDDAISRVLLGLNKPVIKGDPNQTVRLTLDMIENQVPVQALERYGVPYKAEDYSPQIMYEAMKRQLRHEGPRLVSDSELNEMSVNGVRVREKAYLRDLFAQNHWDFCTHSLSIVGALDLNHLPTLFKPVRLALAACELDISGTIYNGSLFEAAARERGIIAKVDALFEKLTLELAERGASSFVQTAVSRWKRDIGIWVKHVVLKNINSMEKQSVPFLKVRTSEDRASLKQYIKRVIATIRSDTDTESEKGKSTAAAASS